MNQASENSTTTRAWPDGEGELRAPAPEPGDDDRLIVDVAGFEGPLDLLLQLAREQKVDLAQISILALAEQYLAFVDQARHLQLDLAADYLVMAAWLAYLKSRLLLPEPEEDEEVSGEELAARLQFRLQRLQAMREAAAQLMARNRLGRDVFARGAPEPLVVETVREYADNLYDLLKAYAHRRQQNLAHRNLTIHRLPVWSLKEARTALDRLVGVADDWSRLDRFIVKYMATPELRRSVVASSLAAALELAREGIVEVRQERAFRPIYLRRAGAA